MVCRGFEPAAANGRHRQNHGAVVAAHKLLFDLLLLVRKTMNKNVKGI